MRRWAGVVLLVVAAMSLGRLITEHLDLEEATAAPFVRTGSLGERVHMEYGDVEVDGVRSGRYLDGNDPVQASGVWLIVDLRVFPRARLTNFFEVAFLDSQGRRFAPEDRGTTCLRFPHAVLPGSTRFHMACYDVPRDAALLAGGKLRVARGKYGVEGSDYRRDEIAEIDLGISLAEAKELVSSELAYKASQGGYEPYSKESLLIEGEAG